MKCEQAQELMAAYVTQELSMDQSQHIAQHIEVCTACQQWHQEVSEMLELWTQPHEYASNPGLHLAPAVMQRIQSTLVEKPISQQSAARLKLQLPKRTVMYHLSIAASLAFVMFHLGVFQHIGYDISHSTMIISNKMLGFASFFTSF